MKKSMRLNSPDIFRNSADYPPGNKKTIHNICLVPHSRLTRYVCLLFGDEIATSRAAGLAMTVTMVSERNEAFRACETMP